VDDGHVFWPFGHLGYYVIEDHSCVLIGERGQHLAVPADRMKNNPLHVVMINIAIVLLDVASSCDLPSLSLYYWWRPLDVWLCQRDLIRSDNSHAGESLWVLFYYLL
jgi:hypothetical protein